MDAEAFFPVFVFSFIGSVVFALLVLVAQDQIFHSRIRKMRDAGIIPKAPLRLIRIERSELIAEGIPTVQMPLGPLFMVLPADPLANIRQAMIEVQHIIQIAPAA